VNQVIGQLYAFKGRAI
jgi:hypothetical protein